MTVNNTIASNTHPARRWFKEPMMWLVVGGPLVVVAASFVTLFLALKYPDRVLPHNPDGTGRSAQQMLAEDEARAAARSQLPAMDARNHVISPTLPKQNH